MGTKQQNLGWAIQQLKLGSKVTRSALGEGAYLIMVGAEFDFDSAQLFEDIAKESETKVGKYVETEAYIAIRNTNKTVQPGWTPTQSDLLAEDWCLLGEAEAIEHKTYDSEYLFTDSLIEDLHIWIKVAEADAQGYTHFKDGLGNTFNITVLLTKLKGLQHAN